MKLPKRTHPERRDDRLAWLTEQTTPGLASEALAFILYSKKWWLTPILVALVLLSLVAGLSGTGVAPLIYTLF